MKPSMQRPVTTTPIGPARTYYEACLGRWRAPVALTLTDAEVLSRSGMSLLNRLSIHLLARWPSWLWRVQMNTTVSLSRRGEVVHTTTLSWLGLPLSRTAEVFTLDPDGQHFTVRGSMTGQGGIDPTATRGEYTLWWLGVEVRQRTERDGDRVTVHQEGPGFRGVQALVRYAPLRPRDG